MNIRSMKKRIFVLIVACIMLVASGCFQKKGIQEDPNHILVAIVCRDGMQYDVSRFEKGMEMAIREYAGSYTATVMVHDQATNFEEALELDTRLAQDPNVTAVVTLQDYDEINVAAYLMNENNKAYFAVEGYLDETAEQGYETFFPFSLNAAHLGNAMGTYAGQQDMKNLTVIHSGTPFEQTQANYFERALLEYGAHTINSLSEPATSQEILATINGMETLDSSAAYLPYYRSYWAVDILSEIQKRQPEAKVLASFTLGSVETVETLNNAEGTILPAFYPLEKNTEYEQWEKRYEILYKEKPENQAAQGYDIMNLILQTYDGDNSQMAQRIRDDSNDVSSLAGNILYDYIHGLAEISNESDTTYPYEYLVIRDGKLIPVNS